MYVCNVWTYSDTYFAGNLITISVIGALGQDAPKFEECFVFAAIGFVAALILAGLGYCYVPRLTRESRKQNLYDKL